MIGVGRITVSQGEYVDLGAIVLRDGSSKRGDTGEIQGPVKVVPGGRSAEPNSIAAVFVGTDGPIIVHEDGKLLRTPRPKDKDQAGFRSLRIAATKRAAGWLSTYDGCCQSYPLPRSLTLYRPGQTLADYRGDNRAIFGWHFLKDGRQFAFVQSFPHGESRSHFELHSVAGPLLAKWDEGEIERPSPEWTHGLQ
ncbi:MAG: hypothetical protein SGI92_28330 [Bryobacteraceae bacterium]|nr:hypothetical protein [Bryobacteraceae bacterium]